MRREGWESDNLEHDAGVHLVVVRHSSGAVPTSVHQFTHVDCLVDLVKVTNGVLGHHQGCPLAYGLQGDTFLASTKSSNWCWHAVGVKSGANPSRTSLWQLTSKNIKRNDADALRHPECDRLSLTTRKDQTTCAACDPQTQASDAKHQKEMNASRTQPPTAKKRRHHKNTKFATATAIPMFACGMSCRRSCRPPSLVTHWK